MCYNLIMKNFLKIFLVILGVSSALVAKAEVTFNVVVLPVDLFKVCANYYCYPEVSNIIADDVIENFNKTGRINSPPLYYVRKALEANPVVKNYTSSVFTRFKNDKPLDYTALKAIGKVFRANSVLLISNDIPVDGAYANRNYWEMLVLSTNFGISYPYEMKTKAVLVDTVNDAFSAPNASDAYAKLEYLKMYSKDILSKSISQNIYLRFFPRVIDPQPLINTEVKPDESYFRYESNTPKLRPKLLEDTREKNDFGETIDNNYGEVMFGI